MLLAETIYRGYGETEAVMDVGNIMVTSVWSGVAGATGLPRYSPVTVTSSLVSVGPGPVHVTLGPECVDTAPVSGNISPV